MVSLWSNFSGQNTQQVIALLKFMCYKWHFQLSRGTHEVEHKHVDDNKDTIEDDVHYTNVRKCVEVHRHCENCKKNLDSDFTE